MGFLSHRGFGPYILDTGTESIVTAGQSPFCPLICFHFYWLLSLTNLLSALIITDNALKNMKLNVLGCHFDYVDNADHQSSLAHSYVWKLAGELPCTRLIIHNIGLSKASPKSLSNTAIPFSDKNFVYSRTSTVW
jgi:hypothetical protein